jgi:predicted aldo/keto reductase-like oxidoreductase
MIILGGALEDQQKHFESSTLVGVSTCKYCMPYENNVNIFLCRRLKKPLKSAWGEIKHYD